MSNKLRAHIDELNQKLEELFAQKQYEDAIDMAIILIELTGEFYGEDHPNFATSLIKLGQLYYTMNEYKSAEHLYKQALEIRRKALSENHPDFASNLNNLGFLYDSMGDYASAELLYKQTLEIRRKVLGEGHPDFAISLNNLGTLYSTMGDYASAESFLKQASKIQRKTLGEEHPNFATTLCNLGSLYETKSDYASAKYLYNQALEIRYKVLGKEHPDFTISLNNLGILYKSMGDYASAEPILKKVLKIQRKTLGEEHPNFASSLNNLGALYYAMGDYEATKLLYKQALEIRRKVLGEENLDFSTSLNNLGCLYETMGDYASAEPLYKQALEIKRKILSENHPNFASNLNNLGFLYEAMGDYESAEPLYKHALEIKRKILGEQHPSFATSLNNLGSLYSTMGDYESAEPLYKQALEISRKTIGEEHPDFIANLNNLGLLYDFMGNYASAEQLLKQALKIRRKVLGKEHPDFATSLNNLGFLYKAMGDYKSAESLYKQALEIKRKIFGENHQGFAKNLDNLGALYYAMGDYASAEPLLKQALEIHRKALGEEHPDFITNLNNIGLFYDSIGDYASAEPLLKQALEISRKTIGEEHPNFTISLNNLGFLYYSMANYTSAEPLLKETLKIRRKVLGEEHPDFGSSLNNLAGLYAVTQRKDESLVLMKQANVIDSLMIGQVFSIGSDRQRLDFLKTLEGHIYFFLSLVYQYFRHSIDAVNSAFQLVLQRKAIGTEVLAVQRDIIIEDGHSEIKLMLKELTDLRMQIARKTLAGPGLDRVHTHQQVIEQLRIKKEKLESNLAKEIPEMKLEERLRNSDLKAVSSIIPSDAALIEFVKFDVFDFKAIVTNGDKRWSPPKYLAFIMFHNGPENIKMIDLGNAEVIDQLIFDYRTEIINNSSERPNRDMSFSQTKVKSLDNSDVGHKLKKILFDSILEAIGDLKRLIIAPDSDLFKLPFEILPLKGGQYIVDEYHISYLSVGRDLLRFKTDLKRSASTPILIADPNFDLGKDDDKTSFSQFKDKLIPNSIKEEQQESKTNQKANISSPILHKISNFTETVTKPVTEKSDQTIQLTYNRISRNFEGTDITFNGLPGTKEEGEAIARILGVQPMMNNQALESLIKNCNSPKILHIASHGFFLSDQERESDNDRRAFSMFNSTTSFSNRNFSASKIENPMLRSGIALAGINTWLQGGQPPAEAEDGILTAEDVTGLNLTGTELVVLSACETGLGEVKTGEGVFGLRRAFTIAGAKTLIMSLWKVPDKQTKDLMINFYQRIIAGEARSDALKNAQLEIRKQYPGPYYWGAFICQGEPGPLP